VREGRVDSHCRKQNSCGEKQRSQQTATGNPHVFIKSRLPT
jgi:hypothetical protein